MRLQAYIRAIAAGVAAGLVVAGLGGCVVQSAPVLLDFSGAPVSGTAPLVVQFQGEVTALPPYRLKFRDMGVTPDEEEDRTLEVRRWAWSFGDGETGWGQEVAHTYEKGGVYSVGLSVYLSNGSVVSTSKAGYVSVTGPAVNAAPTADAGPDVVVALGETAVLDGTGSSDPEGAPLAFRWSVSSRPSGSLAALSNASWATPTFRPDGVGEYVLQLVVNDGDLDSAADSVLVTVESGENALPEANAGPDRIVVLGTEVTLDASQSVDDDGDVLTYTWQLVSIPPSSNAVISDPMAVSPTFVPDIEGEYVVEVRVEDEDGDVTTDTMVILTGPSENTGPMAEAGSDRRVRVGAAVLLDGSRSTDPDGDALHFEWTLTVKPSGSAAVLSDVVSARPEFVADAPGAYVVQLMVSDGVLDSRPDHVGIMTSPIANTAPRADAGPAQRVLVGETVELDGRRSHDVDGDTLTYRWAILSGPEGAVPGMVGKDSVRSSFVASAEGRYVVQLIVNDGLFDSRPDTVVVNARALRNRPPVADAGADQVLRVGATAHLDGARSSDPDGDDISYQWTLISKPEDSAAAISDGTEVAPSLGVDVVGDYVAHLVVSDGSLESAPDAVIIYVRQAPGEELTADAGPDQTVPMGTEVLLDGRGSAFVGDGSEIGGTVTLEYAWAFLAMPGGSAAVLVDAETANPRFVADRSGLYRIQLIVQHGDLVSAPDVVEVMVFSTNRAPVANAGPDRTVLVGTAVPLDGSASTDEDGDPLGYRWTLISMPEGSAAALSDAAIVNPTFVADLAGVYVVELVVNDGECDGVADTVTVTTGETPNVAPVADAGPDQEAGVGSTIYLDGSASHDEDEDPLIYRWAIVEAPAGSTAALWNASSATVSFVADVAGAYRIELVVNDGTVDSEPDEVTVTATAGPTNHAPEADAGMDQTVYVGAAVALDGSHSTDADGEPLAYAWSMIAGPDGSVAVLNGGDTVSPDFVPDVAGTYVIQLIVSDGIDDSEPDTVAITAVSSSAPVILVEGAPFAVEVGETLNFGVTATDADGDVVVLTAAPSLANATFVAVSGLEASGTFGFAPDGAQQGLHILSFTARDPSGLFDVEHVEILVRGVNRAPTLDAPDVVSVDEGSLISVGLDVHDPDGDALTVTAAPLPDNALFVPATATITFAPDYDQAGAYDITCEASDGELSSGPKIVHVTVRDVSEGGPTRDLVLQVDPAESPSLLTRTRITGVVNPGSSLPPAQRITSSLVVGMNPASAEQGESVQVTLMGQASGDYATHFVVGVTVADFGEGVVVEDVTVNSGTEAVVDCAVDARASVGARSVTLRTGDEVAVCLQAFNVVRGAQDVSGRIVDATTGAPLSGVVVSVEGTTISTRTDADGYYVLHDVPSGEHTLVLRPTGHDLVRREILVEAGVSVDVGEVATEANVFDPDAPPSVSLFSVVGRGITDYQFKGKKSDLKQALVDAMLLVGGEDAGVLDGYGNQLNPAVDGNGYISLTADGQEQIARQLQGTQTFPLADMLASASFGLEWGGEGERLGLDEWMDGLQEVVNAAWANPTDPDNRIVLLIFNNGKLISASPPTVSAATRLNHFQAFLFSSSLLTYAKWFEIEGVKGAKGRPAGQFIKYWRGFYDTRGSWPLFQTTEAAAMMHFALGYSTTVAFVSPVLGVALLGQLAPDFMLLVATLGNVRNVPDPPEIVEVVRNDAGVAVTFRRSEAERLASSDQYLYVYNLLYFESSDAWPRLVTAQVLDGTITSQDAVFIDADPPTTGTGFYAMTVTRRQRNMALTGAMLDDEFAPWWGYAVDDEVSRLTLWRRQYYGVTSDYSKPAFYRADPFPFLGDIDAIAVEMTSEDVYISTPGDEGWIYVARTVGDTLGERKPWRQAGFKEPGQHGLAIDRYENLYTDNAASDATYGGRIFRFDQPDGGRTFVGTINYFSQMLMYANPVVSGPMVFGWRDLYVWDDLSREVKAVPVSEDWDVYRRVGKPYAKLDDATGGAAIDMEYQNDVYVLRLNQITRISRAVDPTTGEWYSVLNAITIDKE